MATTRQVKYSSAVLI